MKGKIIIEKEIKGSRQTQAPLDSFLVLSLFGLLRLLHLLYTATAIAVAIVNVFFVQVLSFSLVITSYSQVHFAMARWPLTPRLLVTNCGFLSSLSESTALFLPSLYPPPVCFFCCTVRSGLPSPVQSCQVSMIVPTDRSSSAQLAHPLPLLHPLWLRSRFVSSTQHLAIYEQFTSSIWVSQQDNLHVQLLLRSRKWPWAP